MRISDWSSDVCSSDLSRASSGGGPGCLKISPVPLLVRLGRRPLDVVPPAALDALEGSPVDEWLDALEGDAEVGGGLLAGHVLAPEIGRASCRERVCQYV